MDTKKKFTKVKGDLFNHKYESEDECGIIDYIYVTSDGCITLIVDMSTVYLWTDGAYFIDNADGDVISVGSFGTNEFHRAE